MGATEAARAAGLRIPADIPNAFVIKLVGDSQFILGDDSDGPAFWGQHGNRTRVGTLWLLMLAIQQMLTRKLKLVVKGATGPCL